MSLYPISDTLSAMECPTPLQQPGEFVLTAAGLIDFGEISTDIALSIKRQAGKIRLRVGKQVNGEKDNYGERHINRLSRLRQLEQKGYKNAQDAAESICRCFYKIYDNGVGLILRTPDNMAAYICIEQNGDENDFYDIKTISPANDRFFKRKKRLWKDHRRSDNEQESTPNLQHQPPREFTGNSLEKI
ncbi:MAG: hypothetical protein II837_01935 [Treponema sp.]|nr:hypothetical protein [Treponema sp.]